MNNPIGSLWNKWDLHIHTDASDGKGSCQEILDEAIAKNIKCIAVTDHHTVDNVDVMKALAKDTGVTVISGVEFRTEYGKASVHMIGLFPDKYDGISLTSEFLKENILNQLGITRSKIIQIGREALKKDGLSEASYFKDGMFRVQVDFRKAANLIHQYGGIVTVHAGSKDNSIDVEMKHEGNSAKNVPIEYSLGPVKEELFREGYIDICDLTKPKEAGFYQKTFGKPSITTSDAHEVIEVGTKACWIKADLTFEGLKQILAEPERISFDEPEILTRIKRNPDKFIRSLVVRRTSGATMPEKWFDNIKIQLNPGLVAVIGNKGSGKSALTDIIALCADTTNQNWAFLTPSKYRMPKPYNRAKQTEAYIQWEDDSSSPIKTLDMSTEQTQPERVKYIPQNFLETLCTTEDDQKFESELKKIIFQYLAPAQRYGYADLDEIINYLTKENADACSEIQSRIREINGEIIAMEAMMSPSYREKLVNELAYKQGQLSNAQSAKPKEVAKPSVEDDPVAKKTQAEIDKCNESCKSMVRALQDLEEEKEKKVKSIQDLSTSKERIDRLTQQVAAVKAELTPLYEKNSLDIDSVFTVKYNPDLISVKIQELSDRLTEIDNQLDKDKSGSLQHQYILESQKLNLAKQKLSAPELEYQKYLKEKQDWEKLIENITGTPEKEGSIKNLQSRIDYIDHNLTGDLSKKIKSRAELVEDLMQKKHLVLETYNTLFAPVVKFIDEYHDELRDYPIEFHSTFTIRNFGDKFFDFVSQQAAGSYYGKEQGQARIIANMDSVDLSDTQSIVNFARLINDDLLRDKRDGNNDLRSVENQLKKGHTQQELYDFIYCMDYVSPFFQLKMNGKPLSSLSPGERGALLLLLYLFIDMDDKPLIIDQPEENLDNESVYRYLVHFIKAAKRKRQIIMVTHNPNLAVVCDADQIIQMKIDKLHGNEVSFASGAIENPIMNKIIVDILEGTYPAFHNRDCKYFDKTI